MVKQAADSYANPFVAAPHGLLSGALWIFAFAIFKGLPLTIGLKFSWITFLFTIGLQVLIEFAFNKQR